VVEFAEVNVKKVGTAEFPYVKIPNRAI
jgi:hypothetical protein